LVSTGLLIIRVVVGLTMAAHGSQKLFGWFEGPKLSGFAGMLEQLNVKPGRIWAIVSALAEGVGGVLVAVGLLTPIAALIVAANMVVVIITVHLAKGFWNKDGGYEWPLAILATMVGVSLIGPGTFSLDRLFRISLPEPGTWIVVAIVALLGALTPVVLPKVQGRTAQSDQA
jgi:putative oxidoreductase